MAIIEYQPGKSVRLQLAGDEGRRSTVWSVTCAKRAADVYVTPRMMGGAVKVSLHQSGSWQVGVTSEAHAQLQLSGSRHWEIWQRGSELAEGVTRAWYLLVPNEELRVIDPDPKARELPAVGHGHALSLEVLIVRNEGTTMIFDDAHIVGRWSLYGRDESCLLVARRILWGIEQQAWINAARTSAAAAAISNSVLRRPEHRYFVHGHDNQGVRFGLELAPV